MMRPTIRLPLRAVSRCRYAPLSVPFKALPAASFSTGSARQATEGAPVTRPGLADKSKATKKQFADYDLAGKTYVVTGGARGLGLALAEALVEAGGKGKPAILSSEVFQLTAC